MMAIKLEQKDGSTLYEVRVESRSRSNRELRVCKQESGTLEGLSDEEVRLRVARIEARLAAEARAEVRNREGDGILWRDLVEDWEDKGLRKANEVDDPLMPKVSKRTSWAYAQIVKDHTKAWMNKPASQIVPADFGDILEDMKILGYTNSSRYNVKVAVNHCFKYGISRRLIPGVTVPPTGGFAISRKESKRPEILNHSQIVTLVEESQIRNNPWYPTWKGVLHLGARSGEAFELRRKDIDREQKLVILERKYNFQTKDIEPLKDKEWRQVPINEECMALFDELDVWKMGPEDYVFPRYNNAWKNGEAARHLRDFCEEIGIPSICFHTLRACWATQLLRAGVEQVKVMAMGGWSDWDTMMRYIRVAGIELDGATEGLKFNRKERPVRVLRLVSAQ
jgi:integrase